MSGPRLSKLRPRVRTWTMRTLRSSPVCAFLGMIHGVMLVCALITMISGWPSIARDGWSWWYEVNGARMCVVPGQS